MEILQDCREKKNQHDLVEFYLREQGITLRRVRLEVGDYMFPRGRVSVDLKKDCEELASDLYRDKKEFNKKYKKCLNYNIKLFVLVEQPMNKMVDLISWKSTHSKMDGMFLLEMIHNIQISYGVRFVFCEKEKTGEILLKILKGNYKK